MTGTPRPAELTTDDWSGESYAVRLLAALARVDVTRCYSAIRPGDRDPILNPCPVLRTEGESIVDWQSILVWLAQRSANSDWLPINEHTRLARCMDGLALARELALSAGLARLHYAFAVSAPIERCRTCATAALRTLEQHVWIAEKEDQLWYVPGPVATIADIALFAHVSLSDEGALGLRHYPAIRRWLDRVRETDRYVAITDLAMLRP